MNAGNQAADAVKYAASRLGFSECRIARAGRSPYADDFLSWLDQGGHAGMEWLARTPERRCDTTRVLPGCRSVIMLSYEYGNEWDERLSRHMARYAWGYDYHPLLEAKLADLDDLLGLYGGTQRCYVDTGPVLERDFAELSGLGWKGKSGLIVRERYGTTCFLATILTDLELPPDEKAVRRCGSCRRCVDSCPTGALGDNGMVDCRRCISYLTIEHHGSIPVEMRPLIGARIYGCDECQKQCPWNRRSHPSADMRFAASKELRTMPLTGFLGLSDDDFTRLFRYSPVRRIKRERLLRNVCVALGNVGNGKDVDSLQTVLSMGGIVEEHALWAIERISDREKANGRRGNEK